MKGKLTLHKAKQIVKRALDSQGLAYSKLTAKSVGFSDLARGRHIFVRIHGWQPSPMWGDIEAVAHANGFSVEA